MNRIAAALIAALVAAHTHAQAPVDIVGSWVVRTTSPVGEGTNTTEISKNGEGLRAVVKGDGGELPYDKVVLKGNDVILVLTIDYEGSPMTITFTGVIAGGKMSGVADFGGRGDGTWSATRN
jgi:hypothetical protein